MMNPYKDCIKSCIECFIACEACLTTSLQSKEAKEMAACIQLERQCADMCKTAVSLMLHQSTHAQRLCEMCIKACQQCAQECAKHNNHAYYRHCMRACEQCAQECEKVAMLKQAA